MLPFKTSLVAALIAAALTSGCFYFINQRRSREAAGLRSQNNRMRVAAHEQHVARAQPSTLSQPSTIAATNAREPAPVQSAARAATPAPTQKPPENYRNEGQATPIATLQTLAWACDRGDTDTVATLLMFDPAAHAKAEAVRAAMPESERSQWSTVDEMAAGLLTSSVMMNPFPSADILAEIAATEPISEDRIRMRLPTKSKDRAEYQRTPTGWKYVITEAMVDAYIAQLKARPH